MAMWSDYKSLNHIEHQNDERYGVRAAFGPIFITL